MQQRCSRLVVLAIFVLILCYPFIDIFAVLFPVRLFGKSIVLELALLLILVSYIRSRYISGRVLFQEADIMVLLFLLASLGVFISRRIVYEAHESYFNYRYFFILFLGLALAEYLSKNRKSLKIISLGIILQGLFTAVLIVINIYFFPHLRISSKHGLISNGIETRDMLLNASMASDLIVCAGFVLLAARQSGLIKLPNLLFWLLLVLMAYATIITGSRYPQLVMGVVLLLAFRYQKGVSRYNMLFILLLLSVLFYYFEAHLKWDFRFDQSSGGRLAKLGLTIHILGQSAWYFLMGAPNKIVAMAHTRSGVTISDNSFILVVLNFGFIFSLLFFIYLIKRLKYYVKGFISGGYFIYLILGFGITNCFLWDPWLFIAMMTSVVLYKMNESMTLHEVQSSVQ